MQAGLKNHVLALYTSLQESSGLTQTQAKVLLLSMIEHEHHDLLESLVYVPDSTKDKHIPQILLKLADNCPEDLRVPMKKTAEWISSI